MKATTIQFEKNKSKLAIASIVLGIIGGIASTFCVLSIICGHMARRRERDDNRPQDKTRIRAAIGLLIGYWGLIVALIQGLLRGLIDTNLKDIYP